MQTKFHIQSGEVKSLFVLVCQILIRLSRTLENQTFTIGGKLLERKN